MTYERSDEAEESKSRSPVQNLAFLENYFLLQFFNFSVEMVAIFLLEIETKNSRFLSSRNQKLEEKNTIFRRVLHMVLAKVFFFLRLPKPK